MRHLPGFVSASLHVSLDRQHVANYAQWTSKAAYEAIFEDSTVAEHMRQAAAIAESFEPILYELRTSQSADKDSCSVFPVQAATLKLAARSIGGGCSEPSHWGVSGCAMTLRPVS